VLDELVTRFLESRKTEGADGKVPAKREASACAVCQEELAQSGTEGKEEQPAADGPSSARFDCGHAVCMECATGMLQAKKDDSPDALNLLACPCARLEGCGGVLFLQETQRVIDTLTTLARSAKGGAAPPYRRAAGLVRCIPRVEAMGDGALDRTKHDDQGQAAAKCDSNGSQEAGAIKGKGRRDERGEVTDAELQVRPPSPI
jgi:hypothetical protein